LNVAENKFGKKIYFFIYRFTAFFYRFTVTVFFLKRRRPWLIPVFPPVPVPELELFKSGTGTGTFRIHFGTGNF
jgi:hypothetical protein